MQDETGLTQQEQEIASAVTDEVLALFKDRMKLFDSAESAISCILYVLLNSTGNFLNNVTKKDSRNAVVKEFGDKLVEWFDEVEKLESGSH